MTAVTWYGHSAFKLSCDGISVLIDPFLRGNPLCPVSPEEVGPVDMVLVTHDHGDHVGQAVEICQAAGAMLCAVVGTAGELAARGVPQEQIFGGIGCNFANPAITGRIFLLIAFAGQLTTWPTANSYISGIDAVSGATPLALIKEGSIEALPAVKNLLFGIRGGCLGETCAIALLIGFVYLVIRRVITPTIPVVYVATIALMSLILGYDPIYMILTGGVLLGGIFMLTDYATSPATELGKVVFAVGAGIITMLIRNSSGGSPEGFSFAVLLMNILCPYIAKLGHKKPFGGVAK